MLLALEKFGRIPQGSLKNLGCLVAYSLSDVQLFATPWAIARWAPLSSQDKILEWFAISFSRGSNPRIEPTPRALLADRLTAE